MDFSLTDNFPFWLDRMHLILSFAEGFLLRENQLTCQILYKISNRKLVDIYPFLYEKYTHSHFDIRSTIGNSKLSITKKPGMHLSEAFGVHMINDI